MALSDLLRAPAVQRLTRDSLLKMEPETAHRLTINALRWGAAPKADPDPPALATRLAGLELPNPLGMAAGFDKNAEVPAALAKVGFGFVEVGTVTPRAQSGNPSPRMFRISECEAVINRLGFNNEGHAAVHARLVDRAHAGILGVNVGANKDSEDFVADYVEGVKRFAGTADYLTVNISSPNTPGLRNLQADTALARLLGAVTAARSETGQAVPLFLKIAPDLSETEMDAIARVVLESGIEGVIVSNTTLSRESVKGLTNAEEIGGLSGAPLFALATRRLAQMRQRLGPDVPIIGVGGIDSAARAVAKLEAGATAVQLYTAMAYRGVGLIGEIKSGLAEAVAQRGLTSIGQLSGTAVADWAEGRGDA